MSKLLAAAIDNNQRWCSTVCAAHGGEIRHFERLWLNRKPSPRYYPNLITRAPASRTAVTDAIRMLRNCDLASGWGIKDSFCDLDLHDQGFRLAVTGTWFGGVPDLATPTTDEVWTVVDSAPVLRQWQEAWDKECPAIFPETLLSDQRIRFWILHRQGRVAAGGISSQSETAIGLSKWFSTLERPALRTGLVEAIHRHYPHMPIVGWTAGENLDRPGFAPLGPMRVWIDMAGS